MESASIPLLPNLPACCKEHGFCSFALPWRCPVDNFSDNRQWLLMAPLVRRREGGAAVPRCHPLPHFPSLGAFPDNVLACFKAPVTELAEIAIWPAPALEFVVGPDSVLQQQPAKHIDLPWSPSFPYDAIKL